MSTSSRSGDCHVIRIEDFDKLTAAAAQANLDEVGTLFKPDQLLAYARAGTT